jgi:hypothetical protein
MPASCRKEGAFVGKVAVDDRIPEGSRFAEATPDGCLMDEKSLIWGMRSGLWIRYYPRIGNRLEEE